MVATIDVKEQKLKLYLDKVQVEEFDYKLRQNALSVSDVVALKSVSDVLALNN